MPRPAPSAVPAPLAPLAVVALACALSVTLLACPPAAKKEPPCSTVGQTCTVSPGKLGTCVQRDDCSTPGTCFDCQSQH